MQPHQECELKLLLEPTSHATLARSDLLARAGGDPRRKLTHTLYFDTPDFALRAEGLSLRIRRDANGAVQTVKTAGPALRRGEWNMPIAGDRPEPDRVPDHKIARFLGRGRIRKTLAPVFRVDVERDVWTVVEGDDALEIVLDSGVIATDDAETPVCEAEIELTAGDPAALRRMASRIGQVVPTLLSLTGKADRGYRLLGEETAIVSIDAGSDSLPIGAAHRVAATAALRTLFEDFEAVHRTGTVESVHRSRVSLRRVRALRSLFRPLLVETEAMEPGVRETGDALRTIARRLGALRDLDVFCADRLTAARSAHPQAPGFAALADHLAGRRAGRLAEARDALTSPDCLRLCLALVWETEGLDRRAGGSIEHEPLAPFLRAAWDRRMRRLNRDARNLGRKTVAERHDVRLAAKKLRYMIEPFAGLAEGKAAMQMLARLKALQDGLGALNDGATAERLVIDLLDEVGKDKGVAGQAHFAAGLIAGLAAGDEHRLRRAAEKARDRLAATRPFWASW